MCRLLITSFLLCCSFALSAQKTQKLMLAVHDDDWMIQHKVKQGETIFQLARQYHAPPAAIAEINNIGYETVLSDGSTIYVPIGAYNYISQQPSAAGEAKPIWYKVIDETNLGRISRRTGVSQKLIQDLNNMADNSVAYGQLLQIGWVRFDATTQSGYSGGPIKEMEKKAQVIKPDTPKPVSRVQLDSNSRYKIALVRKEIRQPDGTTAVYLIRDTIWADTLGLAGNIYMGQTLNERRVVEENGTVVFYDNPGKVTSSKSFFALHNTLRKGTVVKLLNPGTGKYVFAKVIGSMPDTKQYHNAVMAVGIGARIALGLPASEEKAWCELKYAANSQQ